MEKKQYKRKVIQCESRLGIFYIPEELKKQLPFTNNQKVSVSCGEHKGIFEYKHNKLLNFDSFYLNTGIDNGDLLSLEILGETLHITKENCEHNIEVEELQELEEYETSVRLSNIVKGNIAEDRIKEYILFHGQDLLNVYKPVIDRNGIDFIVMQNGFYHPIYLQIKSRYYSNFENKETEIYISENTFTSHVNFYVVCVYFNDRTLEMLEDILFIPSEIVEREACKKDDKLKLTISFIKDKKNVWSKYLVNITQLIDKILDEFSLMGKYYK